MTARDKRIATIPADVKAAVAAMSDDQILALHDLTHVEMERRHGRSAKT